MSSAISFALRMCHFFVSNICHLTMDDVSCDFVSSSLAYGAFSHIFSDVAAVHGRTELPPPEKCTITSWSHGYYYDDLHRYTSLVFTHFSVENSRLQGMLDRLPPLLCFLRITRHHFFSTDVLMPYFLAHPDAFPKLEELILPMRLQTAALFADLRM
ncbi:hypothetical protein JCM1840_005604 [Sporobolomyces johnsonii]